MDQVKRYPKGHVIIVSTAFAYYLFEWNGNEFVLQANA